MFLVLMFRFKHCKVGKVVPVHIPTPPFENMTYIPFAQIKLTLYIQPEATYAQVTKKFLRSMR
jgi:hypothetical protein